ncbi:MAG: FkbM family methyltransferase, partial [Planctomycetota bacterium]
ERLHAMHRIWRYRLRQERLELALVRKLVAPGQTVLDVGGNKGAYTYWLSKAVGPSGSVYAFEPQPELAQYIEDSARTFRLSNVKVINKALSCESGQAELFRPDCHPLGGASLEECPGFTGTYMPVVKQRLDDFVAQTPDLPRPISFIKLDVQDHELRALQGGEQVLRGDRPTLLFECTKDCWDDLARYLESIGYVGTHVVVKRKLYRLDDPKWKTDFDEYLGNFLFVHASQVEKRQAA